MSQKTIFFVVHAGFTTRYLLQTDIFAKLQEFGHRIVIISPNGDDQRFCDDYKADNICFERFEYNAIKDIQEKKIHKLFKQTRSFTLPKDLDINTILEKVNIARQNVKEHSVSNAFIALAPIFISRFLRSSSTLRSIFVKIENWIFRDRFHKRLFEKYNPKLLVIADLGTIDISNFILREARLEKVPIVSIILSWDNLTSKGIGTIKPDYAVAWNQNMINELVQYHNIPLSRCFLGGVAHFDSYFRNKKYPISEDVMRKALKLNHSRELIVFGTSSPAAFKENIHITKLLLSHIQKGNFSKSLHLVVRLHPAYITRRNIPAVKSELLAFDEIARKYEGYCTITCPVMEPRNTGYELPIQDMIMLGAILKHSRVLVTQFSTLMLEAAIFDLPIVNVGFDKFRGMEMKSHEISSRTHLRRILDTGFTRTAETEEQMLEEINQYLADPSLERQERKLIRDDESGPNKGKAGESIAVYVDSLLYNKSLVD